MDEIDAQGRQMLLERPFLTRGRLSVFRQAENLDQWFPHLKITLKRSGTDQVLWHWTSHQAPIDDEEPPPYGEDLLLEKYFQLESPLRSPRGVEAVFWFGPGATNRGSVSNFSASLYLYPDSVDQRGVQVAVVDFANGLSCASVPLFVRCNFPW